MHLVIITLAIIYVMAQCAMIFNATRNLIAVSELVIFRFLDRATFTDGFQFGARAALQSTPVFQAWLARKAADALPEDEDYPLEF